MINCVALQRSILVGALLLGGLAAQAFAQLPPFRFVGLPEQLYPSGKVTFLNDRILVDDGGHYIYHVKTGKWSALPNFDRYFDPRLSWSLKMYNDSLIGFKSYHEQSQDRHYVWDLDNDSLVFNQNTDNGSLAELVVPKTGFIRIHSRYPDYKTLIISVTDFTSDETEQQTVPIPTGSDRVYNVQSCSTGGFWVGTVEQLGRALWWTRSFDDYQLVARFDESTYTTATQDGKRVVVVINSPDADTLLLYSSATESPARTIINRNFFQQSISMIDQSGRVWNYRDSVNDGFYRASTKEPAATRVAMFDRRTRVITPFYINTDGSIMTATSEGLQISRDDGQTWTQISRPQSPTMTLGPSTSLRIGDDGSLMIVGSDLHWFDPMSATFKMMPIATGSGIGKWYRRGHDWLLSSNGRLVLRDERGLVADTTKNVYCCESFVWNDSVIVRWRVNPYTSKEETQIGTWTPGSGRVLHEDHLKRRFENVYEIKQFSNGMLYLGGNNRLLTFSKDGTIEGAIQNTFSPPYPLIVTLVGDSLLLIYTPSAFGSIPIDRLDTFVVDRREQLTRNISKLIEGHDGHAIAIQSDTLDPDLKADSLMIFDIDFRTFKVRRFENITESRVYDIAYDPIHRVYYALTERGLYRSDPVVTSVEEDVHQRAASDVHDRPASGVQRPAMWYNVMGEQVQSPTNSGVYLKIEFDDKGQMVTEKELIP